jgi:Uma2 family endonuclease
MTIAREIFPKLTPEDYLIWETQQPEKHEYIDGQIYAMGGGSKNHSLIAVRLLTLLANHLGNGPCEVGNSDLCVKIADLQNYTYPDISVTYDPRDQATHQYISYPCLIAEVLSASTEAYDRGGKFRLYRHNPVLVDYLLVSSTKLEIDLYHKDDVGNWLIFNYQAGDLVDLKSINLSFPVEQIYRGLNLLQTPD